MSLTSASTFECPYCMTLNDLEVDEANDVGQTQNEEHTLKVSESDIESMPQRVRANFVNSLSGYKSANLVGTTSKDGVDNLAIISSVFHIGANPPLLGMIMRPHTVSRDTLKNIKETGVYTINHVSVDWVDKAHQTSARYNSEDSEFDRVNLTLERSKILNVPYVKESPIKISMATEAIQLIELNKTELVIGRVKEVWMSSDYLLEDGYIDVTKANIAAISGLDSYHSAKRKARFSYAKPDCELTQIKASKG